MKEQTKKSILLIVICAVTLLVLFVAIRINQNRKIDILSKSGMKDYLREIKYEEISTHVVEQPNTIIYVSNSSEKESNNFDKIFKKVIKKYNLDNEIIYININGTTIMDPFYQYAPQLIYYEEGEIVDVVDCTVLKSYSDIVNSLKERNVIND